MLQVEDAQERPVTGCKVRICVPDTKVGALSDVARRLQEVSGRVKLEQEIDESEVTMYRMHKYLNRKKFPK